MRILAPGDLPHYVYEDYLRWEGRWELIEGIAYAMSPAPAVAHQKASQKIARLLDEALRAAKHAAHCCPSTGKSPRTPSSSRTIRWFVTSRRGPISPGRRP